MEDDGKMSFTIPKGLIKRFRTTVKKSGYTQKFLVSKIMEEIIKELEEKECVEKHAGEENENS